MSLITPTVAEINANIIAQIEATINQTIPLVPKAFIRVLAKVLAAVFVLEWKYGGFIFLQIFVKTATIEIVEINGVFVSPLKEWGRLIGAGDPVAATQAILNVDIVVESQTGSLSSGTPFINSATGVTYVLVGSVLLDAAIVQGTIQAAGDQSGGNGSGEIGNASVGDIISFVNPIAQVQRDTTVATVTSGVEQETTDAYRQRIIDRFQKRPQGGALIDYEIWGEEVAGVINIYPYTGDLAGQVDVYSEVSGPDPDGIPDQSQLDAVFDAIEFDENGLASRRPANAFVNSFPITRTGFDVTVSGITDVSDVAALQTQITAAMIQFMLDRAPFVSGVTVVGRTDSITPAALTAVAEDLVTAAGGVFNGASFKLEADGGSLVIYILGQGEKAKATSVAYN